MSQGQLPTGPKSRLFVSKNPSTISLNNPSVNMTPMHSARRFKAERSSVPVYGMKPTR